MFVCVFAGFITHVSFQHGHILQQRRSQWVEHIYWCHGCNLKITRRSSWIHNQSTHCERPKGLSTIDFQWGLWWLSWTFNDSTNCGYVERGDGTICICAIHGKNLLLEACKDRMEHTRTWGSCSIYYIDINLRCIQRGDVLEIQALFMVVPLKANKYKMLIVLRAIMVLDNSAAKVSINL